MEGTGEIERAKKIKPNFGIDVKMRGKKGQLMEKSKFDKVIDYFRNTF